jgi:acetyl esterase/lipase
VPVPLGNPADPNPPGGRPPDPPYLLPFLPAERHGPNRPAVVVTPGGGYQGVCMTHEGVEVGGWLQAHGFAAFIVRYRVAPHRHPVPSADARRAIRLVRARAAEWNVDPDRIGLMGFSAGGHLAMTVATEADDGRPDAADPVERASTRLAFLILGYPVITFVHPAMHAGSRNNLLGPDPDPELARALSGEHRVTPRTPPTFLMHADDDTGVPSINSVLFYNALRTAGVRSELHIYETGGHGFGFGEGHPWLAELFRWLRARTAGIPER